MQGGIQLAAAAGLVAALPLLLRIDAVAMRLDVSPSTIRRWTRERRIPQPVRIAHTVRWRAVDLDVFAQQLARPGIAISTELAINGESYTRVEPRMAKRGPGRGTVKKRTSKGRVVWYADYRDATGARRRIDVGATRVDAERVLAKLIRDRDLQGAGLFHEEGVTMQVDELVQLYVGNLRARTTVGTPEKYERQLTRMIKETGWRMVRDITRDSAMTWREKKCARGASNSCANNYLIVLKAALNHAIARGRLHANPLAGLNKLPTTGRHARRRARALTDEECDRLLTVAAADDRKLKHGFPQEPLLFTLLSTGARITETARLTWADFDAKTKRLRFRAENTKTQAEGIIPITDGVVARLTFLAEEHVRLMGKRPDRADRIFLGRFGGPHACGAFAFRTWFFRMLKRAGIPRVDETGGHVHLHAMRHTFATRLARAGVPPQTAKLLTRHKSERVLMAVYTHMGIEDAKAAIECLPSLGVGGSVSTAPREVRPAPPSNTRP